MSDVIWKRSDVIRGAHPGDRLRQMKELEDTEGWKLVMKLVCDRAQDMRDKASKSGIDPNSSGQLINHNKNVFTATGLLLVKDLVSEIKSQAAAVLKERPDAGR